MTRPIPFTSFLRRVAPDLPLTEAQRVLVTVSFDGVEPSALNAADRALADRLFGGVDIVPAPARVVSSWVKGARIGGTLLCALRLLHLGLTARLPNVAAGELAVALFVAPDLRLARQALRYALGAAKAHGGIAIESETGDAFIVVRPDGRRVALECLPATRGGSALRGRTLVGALLSEAAFFRDENYAVNDIELFRAVLPRIVPGGQVLIESTPFAELGLLYEIHLKNFGHPVTSLVAECPTLLMRDDEHTALIVAAERERDSVNAAREFDVRFMSAGAGVFFDPKLLDDAVDDSLTHPAAPDPSAGRASGGDFGFVSDSSALTIVQTRGRTSWLAFAEEVRPQPGAPLRPSDVAKRFAGAMRKYRSAELVTDGHYLESIREHVEPFHIRLIRAPKGQTGKLEAFLAARQLIADKRIRIPPLPRLVAQLKSVVARPAPGGGLSITIPRRKGMAHGDLASAFVLSCWTIIAGEGAEKHKAGFNTKVTRLFESFARRGEFGEQDERRMAAVDTQRARDLAASARAVTVGSREWLEQEKREWEAFCRRGGVRQ